MLRSLARVAIALILAFSAQAVHAEGAVPVRIFVLKSSLATVIHEIAMQRGYYAANGLDVKEVSIRSGEGSTGVHMLFSGETDVYFGALADIFRLNSQALENKQPVPLAVIAAGSVGSTGLVLRKDLPYASLADLKGLRIGVSSLGSAHLVRLRYFLATQNLTTDALGLKIIAVASDLMPQALLTKQIDGFLHSQPAIGLGIVKAGGKRVLSRDDFGAAGKSPGTGVVVQRAWAEAHRDTVERVARAIAQASEGYPAIPRAEMVKIFDEYQPAEPEVLDLAYDDSDPRMYDLRTMADNFFKVEVAAMKERGEILPELKMEDVFDFSYAKPEKRP